MKKHIIGFGFLFSAIIFSTCTYRSNDPNICFSNDVLPIFVKNCVSCHGSSGGYTFSSYDGIIKGVEKHHPLRSPIYKAIKGSTPKMPPESHNKLTGTEVDIIKTWISMGAPNSSNCGICDTSQHKFSADIQPILNSWCTGNCHTSTSQDGGFDLSNYIGVKSCGQSGKLMNSIKHSSGAIPMPSGGGKIQDCDITKIQNWVSAGYPNN